MQILGEYPTEVNSRRENFVKRFLVLVHNGQVYFHRCTYREWCNIM